MPGCKDDNPAHTKLLCPKALKAIPASISQISLIPDQINALNIRSTSVALPTAVYTAQNLKAKELPLDQRVVSVLADSAAQRSLCSRSIADKLGFEIKNSEQACLIGYGGKKPQNAKFDVVSIWLGLPSSNKTVKIDAYVVDNLQRNYNQRV